MATRTFEFDAREIGSIETAILRASRGSLLVLLVVFAAATMLGRIPSLETQMILYLVGMVALNLPHGGYEHFTNLRQRGLPVGGRYVAAYVLFVAGFIALFLIAPLFALVLAFATAVAKGGHGGLRVLDALVGTEHLEYRSQRALAALVRGGAVMIVPFVFWTDTYVGFTGYMLALFDAGAALPDAATIELSRTVFGGLFAVGLLAHLGGGYLTGGPTRSWLLDVFETSLLIAYFAVVPVVVAIGLYFPLWYSLRQSARSLAVERRTDGGDDGLPVGIAWAVLVVGALATAVVAATLWVVVPNPMLGGALLPGLVAFYTIFVCIIALPHVVVGEWLDVDRGIWYVP